MPPFGPMYCETPDSINGIFPVEPWNAYSSMVIVVFGLLATMLVARRAPRSYELYLVCALLVVNGVGSTLWHGLRERWALTLDVMPALFFVLLVAVLWARKVAPLWQALLLGAVFLVTPFALSYFELNFYGRFGSMGIVITAAAIWLVTLTMRVSRAAALSGGVALVLAIGALTFRSIDSMSCDTVSVGSHFLWHILLSSAAFLCIRTLVLLAEATPPQGRLAPAAGR